MKIAVIGGRDFSDECLLSRVLSNFVKEGDRIISGGATGADTLAKKWAEKHGVSFTVFEPASFNANELLKRNALIAAECDVLIAFPTEKSKGTRHTIRLAKANTGLIRNNKRVIIFEAKKA